MHETSVQQLIWSIVSAGHEVVGHENLAASEWLPMDPRDGELRTPRSTLCSPRAVSAAQDSAEMETDDEKDYPETYRSRSFMTAGSVMTVVKPPRTPDRSARDRRNEGSTRHHHHEGQVGAK